jgi:aryl-alcohol dehydrogenase-like predicted oxidoreductase
VEPAAHRTLPRRIIDRRRECLKPFGIDLQVHFPPRFLRRSEMNAIADLIEQGKIRAPG